MRTAILSGLAMLGMAVLPAENAEAGGRVSIGFGSYWGGYNPGCGFTPYSSYGYHFQTYDPYQTPYWQGYGYSHRHRGHLHHPHHPHPGWRHHRNPWRGRYPYRW